jgi:hypothetical protein
MKTRLEPSPTGGDMFRGIVMDDDGKELARTRPYYNRRNAKAALIALRRDIQTLSDNPADVTKP